MDFTRLARRALGIVFAVSITIIIIISAPQAAVAAEKADVVATVHQFFDNLDEKTMQKALAACDSPVSILDEFPPHVWHGPTGCADWFKGLAAYNEKSGITDGVATLDITGDRAYFVAPAVYTFKQQGKPVKEARAVFTVGLRRTDAGWRITSWTWSKH
jgi:ketosteroid isomerase-like protein